MQLNTIFQNARTASYSSAAACSEQKNNCLEILADNLVKNAEKVIEANKKDLHNAKENGMAQSMLDRLALDEKRICAVSNSVRKVKALRDPIGNGSVTTRPNGLMIQKMTVPLGVVGIIYEARPNVTADAASLCIKTGNACILRGGKEAVNTNIALEEIIQQSLLQAGLDKFAVQVLGDTSREGANALMKANGHIDVLIPRGGKGLIHSVVENATVPVIETGAGNCHVYIDEYADVQKALSVTFNAKTSRVSVCNSAESLIVHESKASQILPAIKAELDKANVELRGCEKALAILPDIKSATDEDFYTEYNDYIMSVKIVSDVKEAVQHINKYSTHHSEAIITENMENASYFTSMTDSAAVYVNASTRFTDGEEFGLGAEIGISTQKLHARGPMGLDALTTSKYVIYGNGQIR